MKCPIDTDIDLVMSDRQGIEIDYCPSCRGVWLDRGEIDKIIERTTSIQAQSAPPATPQQYTQPHNDYHSRRDYDDDDDHHRLQGQPTQRKHKESWLSDLFD